ncbi:MAG: VTT domain-containing protein [Rhodospirillaceae bacterium]
MTDTQNMEAVTPPRRPAWLRLWPLAVLVGGAVAFFALGLDQYLSFEALRDHRQALLQWTADNQALAVVLFAFGYALVVAFSLPGATWMTLAGGFLFGTILASVVVVTAATVGAVAIFLIARYALADFFRAKMGAAGQRMEAGFRENALSYLLFLRLVPVFPFWLVNLVPAFLGVPLRTYVVGTFVGIVPGSAVYCSVGNGLGAVFDAGGTPDLGIIFQPEILGPIVGLAVLSLVPIVYKRLKTSKT